MYGLTGDRSAVTRILERTIVELEQDHADVVHAGMEAMSLADRRAWQPVRDDLVESLQAAWSWDRREREIAEASAFVPGMRHRLQAPGLTGVAWYLPRNRTLALFQSALDEYLERKSADDVSALTWSAPEQLSVNDPLWMAVLLQKLRALRRPKAVFPRHESSSDLRFQVEDQTRIALVSDWGAGNDSAQAVAKQIEKRKPHHIIHLGGIYYSGDEREIRSRFLDGWPKPESAHRSWALNGSREMYSGGQGYFHQILPEFAQPASYFNLGNDHWRIMGLDTAYVDGSLNLEQADWLAAQIESAQKMVFLSHHSFYSAFERTEDRLTPWVDGILSTGKVAAWFWGTEHKLALYERRLGVKGRAIGHGSIPYLLPAENSPREDMPLEFIHTRARPDRADVGVNGFALLTLDRKDLHVEYIDQDGKVAHEEDL